MKKFFKNPFVMCGLLGWGFECLWTGIKSIKSQKNKTLPCTTSLWMFFIYGMASFLKPIYKLIHNVPRVFRGIIYTLFIFSTEMCTGIFLKKHKACPWDYSKCKLNYKGVIRFDYAPLWFIIGLIYENVLKDEK